jgi:Cd2+/Zn2+-exporting ATPase
VLVKGGGHLERLAGVRVMAFDKTGTLTHGELRVAVVRMLGPGLEDGLAAAAAVEQRSEHPIARAVVEWAGRQGVLVSAADDVRALPGLGAEGRWNGRAVVVGNARLMRARGLYSAEAERVDGELAAEGYTAVHIAVDGSGAAVLGVGDRPRTVAPDVMRLLRGHGIAHISVLTGDSSASARLVAHAAGVTDVRASLLPEDKVAAVHELRAAYGPVAMVGDGVNDAPALASADVGIAMGAMGSAAALETADIALMSDELQKIPYAVWLSRAALANIRTNVAMSLGLKAAVLVLAMVGLSTLWMAVLADPGASVLVVANAMRLLRHN